WYLPEEPGTELVFLAAGIGVTPALSMLRALAARPLPVRMHLDYSTSFEDQVVIVTSEELMSLYAANNVARAVRNYSANGAKLSGLVANLRDPDADRAAVSRFAGLLGAPVLAWLERDPAVRRAEYARNTVVEAAPQSAFARSVEALAGVLLADAGGVIPTPLTDIDFQELSRRAFVGAPSKPVARRGEAAAASVTVHEESRDRDETGLARRHELLERALARLAAAPVRTGSGGCSSATASPSATPGPGSSCSRPCFRSSIRISSAASPRRIGSAWIRAISIFPGCASRSRRRPAARETSSPPRCRPRA
ncbi:MAG: hypothetical protein ABL955_15845, partial [Elusimicrobiota bacterium]